MFDPETDSEQDKLHYFIDEENGKNHRDGSDDDSRANRENVIGKQICCASRGVSVTPSSTGAAPHSLRYLLDVVFKEMPLARPELVDFMRTAWKNEVDAGPNAIHDKYANTIYGLGGMLKSYIQRIETADPQSAKKKTSLPLPTELDELSVDVTTLRR